MNINPDLEILLRDSEIERDYVLNYLIAVHFGLDTAFYPQKIKQIPFSLGIITRDYVNDGFSWKVPLFSTGENAEAGFDWISDWMDLFKEASVARRGSRADVLKRMKEFLRTYPSIGKNEIIEATKEYLKTVSDPTYVKTSHKFIYEGVGKSKSSMLLQWIEITEEKKKRALQAYDNDVI